MTMLGKRLNANSTHKVMSLKFSSPSQCSGEILPGEYKTCETLWVRDDSPGTSNEVFSTIGANAQFWDS
ncbi:hypothetical protein, partial [Streptomyces sp. SID5770]|uniref:hypothetical protein n=1 Tax=Streptomyces sp. SID5770 TaxID=2690308 RepID=UPI001F43FBCE